MCLGEMATWLPLPGAIPQFCSRYVDPAMGFAVGWNVGAPSEASPNIQEPSSLITTCSNGTNVLSPFVQKSPPPLWLSSTGTVRRTSTSLHGSP